MPGRYPPDEDKGIVIAVQGSFSAEQFLEHGHGFELRHIGEIASWKMRKLCSNSSPSRGLAS